MFRMSLLFFVFLLFFQKGVLSEEPDLKERSSLNLQVQKLEAEGEELRAFTLRKNEGSIGPGTLVYALFAIVGVGFIIALVFIFFYYESSFTNKDYKQTEIERPEGFVPYRRSSSDHHFN